MGNENKPVTSDPLFWVVVSIVVFLLGLAVGKGEVQSFLFFLTMTAVVGWVATKIER